MTAPMISPADGDREPEPTGAAYLRITTEKASFSASLPGTPAALAVIFWVLGPTTVIAAGHYTHMALWAVMALCAAMLVIGAHVVKSWRPAAAAGTRPPG